MKTIQRSLIVAVAIAAMVSQASIPTTYPTGSGISIGYSGGHVTYGYNSVGDRIPDYSSAGYGGGGVVIPNPPVTTTLNPDGQDDTMRIQNAVNAIQAMPVGANGFRGVLKLNAGVYFITNPILVSASGVVIRGAGSGTSGTILRRTVNNGDAITIDNGGGLKSQVGSTFTVTNGYVPVGATYFALNTTAGLSVGSTVEISRPGTDPWILNLPEPQTNRNYGLGWDRIITEIDGNRIRLDAPINVALDKNWGGGTLFAYTWTSRLTNCGVEDIRADAPGDNTDSLGNTDGNFITFNHCLNCWVRRCYNDKMRGHTVKFDGSKWCTAEDINSFHNGTSTSHSGASTQIFSGSYSESILFHHITAQSGGFEFTAGSNEGGPIVFTECSIPDDFAASGPHMQGNAGMLWDACNMPGQGISVQYQGHGWGGFNCLAYNVDNTTFNFERPNTVHQWIFGCTGSWNPANNGSNPEVVSFGTHLSPAQLYRAQLIDGVGSTQTALVLGDTTQGDTDTGVAADFTMGASPASQSVVVGNGTSYTVNVGAINGFNDTVSLSVTGLPAGATATFNPSAVIAGNSSALNVSTTSSTVPGSYTLLIKGTSSANVAHTTSVTLTVTAAGPATVTAEAELLQIVGTSGDTVQTNSEAGYSNGQAVQYNSNGAGDYITFRLPNVAAGTYDVIVGYKTYTSRGIVQVSAGPAGGTLNNVGVAIDEYGSPSSYTSTDLGNWTTTTTGSQDFKFAITGHNAGSSGYSETIDYIKLVPVSAPTVYEAESLAISVTSGDTISTNTDGGSNGAYVQYYGTAANDYIVFTLPNVAPGTYLVTVGYKQNTNRGIVQTQVGPAGGTLGNLGAAIDQYGGSAFTSVDVGTWTIGTQGDKSVKFLVTGRNASSSGYNVTVDYVTLTPQ